MPLLGRMKVCARRFVFGRACCANPVHGLAARAFLGDDRLSRVALAQAAQLGVTALPLARAPEVAAVSRHIPLPAHLHAPLVQRMVLLKNANPAAAQWMAYLQSAAARQVFQRFGFEDP